MSHPATRDGSRMPRLNGDTTPPDVGRGERAEGRSNVRSPDRSRLCNCLGSLRTSFTTRTGDNRPMTSRPTCSCGFGCGPAIRRGLDAAIARSGRSFRSVVGRDPADFCCPVCLRELEPRCATRGHYPAASVAGTRWTLACKACNSFLGTAFEADAERHFSAAKSNVRMSSSSVGPLRVDFEWQGKPFADGTPISMRAPKGVGQEVLERIKNDLTGGDRILHLYFRGANPDRVRRAVLSWAYLAAFDQYGYAFALNSALRPVRAALLNPDETEIRPSAVLWRHDQPELGKGHAALVLAVRPEPLEVRLMALAVDFDLATGVLPLAHDTTDIGPRDLETLLVSDSSPWLITIEPIERFIPSAAGVLFESSPRLVTGPYLVVGVTPDDAEVELLEGRSEPALRRPPGPTLRVPEEPPGELPHRLTKAAWHRLYGGKGFGERYRADLFDVAVEGHDPSTLKDVSDRHVDDEVTRLRARFPLGARPHILHRGQLIVREGRELLWLWGMVVWPDGTRDEIGPFFTRAAFIEAAHRLVAKRTPTAEGI